LQAYALPLPIEIVKALSGEFKGMVANYYLLEVASFLGSQQETTEADWRAVANLLERSSSLDPYFRQTYRFAQATLPWHEKFEQALTILERSKDHLPWDWQPGFFIGFNYHFFIGDNETASMKLMEASRVKDAPVALATLAARLASKAGQTRTAIEFLSAVLEKTDDEETRNVLNERILALKGVQEIQSAIDRFKVLFGRMPDKLDDLVDNSILSVIPTNPYGRPYSFKDGNAEF
jgi:tetratricopeptide (TPR) repeat protein